MNPKQELRCKTVELAIGCKHITDSIAVVLEKAEAIYQYLVSDQTTQPPPELPDFGSVLPDGGKPRRKKG